MNLDEFSVRTLQNLSSLGRSRNLMQCQQVDIPTPLWATKVATW